jgi:hypothetical protein
MRDYGKTWGGLNGQTAELTSKVGGEKQNSVLVASRFMIMLFIAGVVGSTFTELGIYWK